MSSYPENFMAVCEVGGFHCDVYTGFTRWRFAGTLTQSSAIKTYKEAKCCLILDDCWYVSRLKVFFIYREFVRVRSTFR